MDKGTPPSARIAGLDVDAIADRMTANRDARRSRRRNAIGAEEKRAERLAKRRAPKVHDTSTVTGVVDEAVGFMKERKIDMKMSRPRRKTNIHAVLYAWVNRLVESGVPLDHIREALQRLVRGFPVNDVTTDANTYLMAMVHRRVAPPRRLSSA